MAMDNQNINIGVTGVSTNPKHRGTSEERPTKGISDGFLYFDTTLGKPIWRKDNSWVDAIGNPVDTVYQSLIDTDHKLSADLLTDGSTNKVVTSDEKNAWDNKQDAISGTTGNFAGFDSEGNLADSGSKPSDFEPAQEEL